MGLKGSTDIPPALLTRDEILKRLDREAWCDVLIIGGGIHGATFAHLAAFNGFRTVLLERGDYAEGTSSRSSKLAHGGIRYLEYFDFRQVYEGIHAREDLFTVAPHLVKRHRFLAPFKKSELWNAALMGAGLFLYGAMSRGKAPLPRWRSGEDAGVPSRGWEYLDGIMSDTRLVIERIIAARQEGAYCLNYAETQLFLSQPQGVEVRFRDLLGTDTQRSIRAGIVVNCAGPWVAESGGMTTRSLAGKVRFSRGSHLIYPEPWDGPALVLPMREQGKRQKGRYYFVTPHPAGTLVGTTERETSVAEKDPLPAQDEVHELVARIDTDLGESSLARVKPHYCFAGIRALPGGANSTTDTAQLSRGHRWEYSAGVLTLVGGKYTSASWTCWQGMKIVLQHCERPGVVAPILGRLLPGASHLSERVAEFDRVARDSGVDQSLIVRAISRLGGRVVRLLDYSDGLEPLGDLALKGEIYVARDQEQAETIEDVLRRRLELEYLPGHGVSLLPVLRTVLGTDRRVRIESVGYSESAGFSEKVVGGEALTEAQSGAALLMGRSASMLEAESAAYQARLERMQARLQGRG